MSKKPAPNVRDAGTGRYVPTGDATRRPGSTVSEPRKPSKK
jgi:hypothetical protein